VIYHTDTQRCNYTISKGSCLNKDETLNKDWNGTINGDTLPGNVDPLVITNPWFYSYCQGNKVFPHIVENSILFFASSESAKNNKKLKIDTVFVIDKIINWPIVEKKQFGPDNVDKWERVIINNLIDKIKRSSRITIKDNHVNILVTMHLVFGFADAKDDDDIFTNAGLLQTYFGKNQHSGRKTFIGKMYNKRNQLSHFSFLPVFNDSSYQGIDFPKDFTYTEGGGYMNPVVIDDNVTNMLMDELNKFDKIIKIDNGVIPYKLK